MASTKMNSPSDVQYNAAGDLLAQNWWLFTLRGVLGIIFGLIALIFPGATILSLVIFFSAYMLVDGIFGIISAVRAIRRKEDRWGLLIFEGLLNIAVGIAAFLATFVPVASPFWLLGARQYSGITERIPLAANIALLATLAAAVLRVATRPRSFHAVGVRLRDRMRATLDHD